MVNSFKWHPNPWTFCKLNTCETQMLVSHVDLQTYTYLPTQYLFWRAFVLAHCTKHERWSNNLDNPVSQHEHQVAWYTERFMQMHLGNPTKKKMCWWVIMGHFPKTGGPAIIRKIGTRHQVQCNPGTLVRDPKSGLRPVQRVWDRCLKATPIGVGIGGGR